MKAQYLKKIIGLACGAAILVAAGGASRLTAQTISVQYHNLNNLEFGSGTYACVGDTILVKATVPAGMTITDLELPNNPDWYGDKTGNGIHGTPTSTSITKRFYTYHPYSKTDPTQEVDQTMPFVIKYTTGSQTVNHVIRAKSCPPEPQPTPAIEEEVKTPYLNKGYSLGYSEFTFVLFNPTSDTGKIKLALDIQPSRQHFLRSPANFRPNGQKRQQGSYRAIPTENATYVIDITYNEGDRTRTVKYGPYKRTVQQLNTLAPDQSAYCQGSSVTFSMTLPENYENMLNQTIDNDESRVGSCFEWQSPANTTVTYKGRSNGKYTFSTTAAKGDYRCTMSVRLKHKDKGSNPAIDLDTLVHYDIPVKGFTTNDLKGFKEKNIPGCPGTPVDLTQYMENGVQATYRDDKGEISTPKNYVQAQKGSYKIYADITAPCPFTDEMTLTIGDKGAIAKLDSRLICSGESLDLTAVVTPSTAPVVWKMDNKELGTTTPSKPSVSTGPITADVTITATVDLCGKTEVPFDVKVVTPPTVSLSSKDIAACPNTPVTLTGTGGSQPSCQLRDVETNTPVNSPQLSANGLVNYILRPFDNLELTYTAGNSLTAAGFTPSTLTCHSSAKATIKAHPAPQFSIIHDKNTYGDNGKICVPGNQTVQLSTNASYSYEWQVAGNTSKGSSVSFQVADQSTVHLTGTDAQNNCDTRVSVQCIALVNAVQPTAVSICPGEEAVFSADNLSNTTYSWSNPQGANMGVNAHELRRNFGMGEAGKYTLQTTRYGVCQNTLTYELKLHPAPAISVIANSPLCVDDELVLNCNLGGGLLAKDPTLTIHLTRDGNAVTDYEKLNGDLIRLRRPKIQTADAGEYSLTVTTDKGCTDTDVTDIEVHEPVDVAIKIDPFHDFCEKDSTVLTAEVRQTGDYTYRWFNDSRTIYEGPEMQTSVAWKRPDDGVLHLQVVQEACTSEAELGITVIPVPDITGLPQDTGLCHGLPLHLSPTSDIVPEKVIWYYIEDNGATFKLQDANRADLSYDFGVLDAERNGRYFVSAVHQGCTGTSDTMRLTVYPLPDIRIDGPTFICDESTVTLTAASRTPGRYLWPHSGDSTASVDVTRAGRYSVSRISEHGCTDSAAISLEARPLPYFSLPPDTSICRGTYIMIYGPDGMDAYLWQDGLEDKDRIADEDGWYVLTAFRNECPYSDSLHVHLTFCGQFHFPTAFTPNDNGINDSWGAISAAKDEDMAEYDLMVFDRNGKKVFHGKRLSEQWDGRYKGQLCPPGIYTYSFRALEKEEGIKYRSSGTVTIVQ